MLGQIIVNHLSAEIVGARNHGVNRVSESRRWMGTPKECDGKRLGFLQDINCPSVIIECCYLSNPAEAKWIAEMENRAAVGRAVGGGIKQYLQGG